MLSQTMLMIRFEPPEGSQVVVTWLLNEIQVQASLPLPFPREQWNLILYALDACQNPLYKFYTSKQIFTEPNPVFRVSDDEAAFIKACGFWDEARACLYPDLPLRLGQHLGMWLFQSDPRVADLIKRVRDDRGAITFQFVPDLVGSQHIGALPWELAHIGTQTLLLWNDHSFPCTRQLEAPSPDLPSGQRPKILLITPRFSLDEMSWRYAQVARNNLKIALADHADIEELLPPTFEALEARLRTGEAITILDFFGHGQPDQGRVRLAFDTRDGQVAYVDAGQLRTLPNLPPFWFLFACHSASELAGEPLLAGFASQLVAHDKVAAVFAMKQTTPMRAVVDYMVPKLYNALSQGSSLQAAAAEVRRWLYLSDQHSDSFYLPILYIRQQQHTPVFPLGLIHTAPSVPITPTQFMQDHRYRFSYVEEIFEKDAGRPEEARRAACFWPISLTDEFARRTQRNVRNLSQDVSTILFAPAGYGKTDHRRQATRLARQNRILVVEFIDVEMLLQAPVSPELYKDLFLSETLNTLGEALKHDHKKARLLRGQMMTLATFWAWYEVYGLMDLQLQEVLPLSPEGQASKQALVAHLQHRRVRQGIGFSQSLRQVLALIGQIGYKGVHFNIDRLDSWQATDENPDRMAEVLRPLLESSALLQPDLKFVVKLFVPTSVAARLRGQGLLADRPVNLYYLVWSDDDLRNMLNNRLAAFYHRPEPQTTANQPPGFIDLCEPGVSLDALFAAANGSPRTLLDLAWQVVEQHCQQTFDSRQRIAQQTIDSVLAQRHR